VVALLLTGNHVREERDLIQGQLPVDGGHVRAAVLGKGQSPVASKAVLENGTFLGGDSQSPAGQHIGEGGRTGRAVFRRSERLPDLLRRKLRVLVAMHRCSHWHVSSPFRIGAPGGYLSLFTGGMRIGRFAG